MAQQLDHWLLSQWTQVLLPVPKWQLTTGYNPSSMGPSALLVPAGTMHAYAIHGYTPNKMK